MPLTATSLRFALDQSRRTLPMPNIGSDSDVVIWRGEPVDIQAALFLGDPTIAANFVSDLSNITSVTLTIRSYNSAGSLLVVKTISSFDATTTFSTWQAGTRQQFLFQLSSTETNLALPSDGTLDVYGAISINTTAGTTVTVGTFRGEIRTSGPPGVGETPVPTTEYYTKAQVDAGFQPLDFDLSLIAALATTGFGLGFLTLSNGVSARTYIGASAFDGLFTSLSFTGGNLASIPTRNFADLQNKPTTLAGYGITDATSTTDSRLSDARTANTIKTATVKGISNLADPLDGQALLYDAVLDLWRPGTIIGGGGGGGGGGSVGGSPTQIQYNNSGNLGGVSFLIFDGNSVIQVAGSRYNITDPTDTSKRFQFDVSNVSTSTTRVVNIPNANSTLAQSKTAGTHKWFSAMSAQGVFTDTQPDFSDLTGVASSAQIPGLTGDVTKSSGSSTTALANIPTGVTMAGYLAATNIAAPGTPATGLSRLYVDSTSKNFCSKNDAGVVNHGVQSLAAVASRWLRSISDDGSVAASQPTEADLLLSDITTNNATAGRHGLLPKLSGSSAQYLDGSGAWSTPGASSGGRPLFAATADAVVPSAITTYSTIVPTTGIGSTTLPADYLTVGRTLRITGAGYYSTVGNITMFIKLLIGGTQITNNASLSVANVTNNGWALEIFLTCRTVGTSGTIYAQGVWSDFDGYNKIGMIMTAPATVNTTIPLSVDVQVAWSTTSSSVSVTTTDFIIDTPAQSGAAGSLWRAGSGSPSNGVGVDNDLYLNQDNGDVYQRASGVYSVITNIKGTPGAVTSVGLSMPSVFSVANTPITGAGTLAVTYNVQNANKVWAGPAVGVDATPTFRALVGADIPSIDWSKISTGKPTTLSGYGITDALLNSTGVHNSGNETIDGTKTFSILPVLPNQSANIVLAGPSGGAAGQPLFRSLVTADLPSGIPNANLANSTITIQGNAIQLGGSTLPVGATPQFARLGLGTTADATALLFGNASSDGITLLKLRRALDTGMTGNFLMFQKADSTALWTIDITGTLTAGTIPAARISGSVASTATSIQTLSNIPIYAGSDPTDGQVLVYSLANSRWQPGTIAGGGGGGSGTVTSVDLSMPSVFSVANHPITSSGTIAVTFATGQTANQFLATPNGSTGAVGLRAIVAADLPGSFSGFGNPVATVGLTATNGSGTAAMRSDGAPALSQAIAPTWTAQHAWKFSDAVTAAFTDILTVGHNSSGTPAASFGASLKLQLKSSTTADQDAGRLGVLWTNATHASRTSAIAIQLVNNAAALTEVARFFASGGFSVNSTSDPGAGIINANTGFRIGNAATSGHFLRGNGTNYVDSVVNDSDISFTDIATGDASTSQHGFLKKLPGGTSTFLRADGTFATPSSSSGLLAFAGNLTTQTSLSASTSYSSGGVTLTAQIAASGSIWRVVATGQYVAISNATARNAQMAVFWGATQLTALTATVPTNTVGTYDFRLEFILNGTSTTAITVAGVYSCTPHSGTSVPINGLSGALAPTSNTVSSGSQTLDLKFSMSNATPADSWNINSVTMERLA